MFKSLIPLAALSFAVVAPATALAQELVLPAASPAASVSQAIGPVTVTVEYSSPAVRGRTVFGDLVPFGEMWRTGANSGTTLTTDGPISLGGVDLAAGSYKIMTIPRAKEWTVVINSDLNARPWRHDEAKDVGRFTAPMVDLPARERMTFLFVDTTDNSAALHLEWAGKGVPMPITVDTMGMVAQSVESFASGAGRKLADAAMLMQEGGQPAKAAMLADKAVGVMPNWYTWFTKARVLHAQGEHKSAMAAAKQAKMLGDKVGDYFMKSAVDEAVATWPKR